MTSSDPSLSHLTCSGREEDAMETSSSSATPTEALSPQDEKDARDHLTPTALVHAASGVVVHNAIDLETDLETGDNDEAKVDKILASVPPSLERQTALPSQPGAFRAGGDEAENDEEDATTFGGDRTAAPPVAGLIEATLVEETAVTPPPVAPIYKGEIVVPEGEEGSSREKANLVTLSKKQVRCFLLAFCSLCFVAIVLSVVLSLVELNGDGDDDDKDATNATMGDGEIIKDLNDIPESYWYEDKPEELWEMLQDRPYITHHVALVSIVHPQMTVVSGAAGALQCSPLQDDDLDWDDAQRQPLRRDEENVVMVSFTCGSEQSMPPSWIHGDPQPDAILLMHDGSADILNGGNRSITCRDATFFPNDTLKYNQVFCSIPHDDAQMNGRVLSFFFSCFSRTPPAPVAAVQTPNLSATCRGGDADDVPPEVLITAPAAVLLSTQRLCRVSNEIVLQNSIVAEDWRNRSQNCSTGWQRDMCLSQTLPANLTVPQKMAWSVCFASPDGTQPCVEVRLPNVTIDDQLRYDVHECAPASLEESLLLPDGDGRPVLQPWNNATWEELRAAMRQQEFWVDQWLLPLSR